MVADMEMTGKTRYRVWISIALSLVLSASCSGPDLEEYRREILELHRAGIQAHLDGDVAFFTKDISPDYFSVGNGEIRYPTLEEIDSNFSEYLGSTKFSRYEDLIDPVIGFSDDGTLAWSIVRVKVEGRRMVDPDSSRDLDFTCAWITLYRRTGGRWIRLGDVSSFAVP
jgi:hypothetical protein